MIHMDDMDDQNEVIKLDDAPPPILEQILRVLMNVEESLEEICERLADLEDFRR